MSAIFQGSLAAVAVFVMGPTASGKSELALELAERCGGELINADALQMYRGLAIGTAQPTAAERARVVHHLYGAVGPEDPFSAGRYQRTAWAVMEGCWRRGVVPLLVGGTGLYLRAIERGLADVPPTPPALAAALRREGEALGWPVLHALLTEVDPAAAARITPRDSQRIMRALGVWRATGKRISQWWREQPPAPSLRVLKLAPDWPRAVLYERINRRFGVMLEQGLLEEARALLAGGYAETAPAMKAVGYRPLFAHLRGDCSLAEATAAAQQESRRYAKRQLTWLRAEAGVRWLDPATLPGAAHLLLQAWLNTAPARELT